MEKYVRVTKTLNDKGRFIKLSDIQTEEGLKKLISEAPEADWYRSLYYYSEAAYTLFSAEGSISGYDGKVFTDKLIFDLDCENLDQAQADAKELLHRLDSAGIKPEESVRIYFSGGKGFHIEVPVAKEFEPDELKSICSNIAVGLETFDPKVYNTNRIFRLENTRHQKSGLYKIELEPYDLTTMNMDQIKAKAKTPGKMSFAATPVKDLTFLTKFKNPVVPKPRQVTVNTDDGGIQGMDEVDFTTCPKDKPRCIHALEHGVMVSGQGQRNGVFLALARYYRNTGMNKEVAYNTLKGIARNNARLYPDCEPVSKDELWLQVINGTFSSKTFKQMPGAFGSDPENETLKFYCDVSGKYTNKPCPLHSHVQVTSTVMQINDVSESFGKFAEDVDNNTVYTGINFIDDNMRITTGTTTLLVGCTGSGKTTMALNVLEHANSSDQASIFFSMDMHKNLIYQKLAQKYTPYTRDEIFSLFVKKDKQKIDHIRQVISDHYGKTYFDFSKTLTMEQIRDRIFDIEQKSGKKIKFVLIDYAGRISGPYSDKYANASYNALKSIEVAEVTDTATIIVSQISRSTGSECTPLRTKRAAKESGDWEESASNVITMWRPFYGSGDQDDVIRMYLAKNRMGPEPEQILAFDGAKGVIRDMDHNELANYNGARGEKAEREYMKQRLNRT